jgi:GH15 family glucan-1,4-alpha-glucosidase
MDKLRHTYDMGIIGNCSYLAYIDTHANVKWMCMPRFDSSFIFGSLIDPLKGGGFSIQPSDEPYTSEQYYLKNTNILITEFVTAEGKFRVTDFAPRFFQYDRYFRPLMMVRKIELLSGNPFIKVKCMPVGNYGNTVPQIVQGSNHIRYLNLDSHIRLTTDISLSYIIDNKPFFLNGTKYLVFTYGVPLEAPLKETAETFFDKTKNYWHNWIKATSIPNIYQEQMIRSALVLKLHQYEDTGGIIAAGTTSLPESDQSERNWDYRYCWMRDTFYTLNAFNNIGHFEELEEYFHFIQNIVYNEPGKISPLYTITGNKVAKEQLLDLEGYMNNKPIRIGNNANLQVQNDVYGQLLVSLLPLFIDNRLNYFDKNKTVQLVTRLLKNIEDTIDEPDSGIWEFRGLYEENCYTSLFHWAGSKAAYKIAQYLNDNKLSDISLKLVQKAANKIEQCYSTEKKAYTKAIGSKNLDASCLQLITMDYLQPGSERAQLHLQALEKELRTKGGLFKRYLIQDEWGKPKNYFIVCSFWYAEALACVGKIDEAIEVVEIANKTANHLGLFSEDADDKFGQWGNFPQTYSHVGLMNAVFRIAMKQDKPIFCL